MRRLAGIALALGLLAAAGCAKETATEPETRPVLVLTYTGPCQWGSVMVTIDGTAEGRVRIPGATSFLVPAGAHTLQVGSTPEFPIEMPADRDLGLTNVPSACP